MLLAHTLQATVKRRSSVIGQSVCVAAFHAQFNAAVIAVKRGAKRFPQPLAEVELEAGDVIVLQAGECAQFHPDNDVNFSRHCAILSRRSKSDLKEEAKQ